MAVAVTTVCSPVCPQAQELLVWHQAAAQRTHQQRVCMIILYVVRGSGSDDAPMSAESSVAVPNSEAVVSEMVLKPRID